ncbi:MULTISPECIES: energy-coupling factor transporter transmembrane component T family protein [Bifidobacterium]|nr:MULTISPECIES: energy-coupling factor transporter transmembrane component T [Bifidobacterium]
MMNGRFCTPGDGWLHRLDTRVKMLISILLVVLCAWWGNWVFLAAVLVLEQLMFVADRTPARSVGGVWAVFAPVAALVVIVMALCLNDYGDTTLWQFGWWRVSAQSLTLCGVVALRIIDIVFALMLTVLTTSRRDWIRALSALRVPYPAASRFVDRLNWLPRWRQAVREARRRQDVRGVARTPLSRLRRWLIAHDLMERYDDHAVIAERLRGVYIDRGAVRRTLMRPAHMRPVDWLVACAAVALAAGVVAMIMVGW